MVKTLDVQRPVVQDGSVDSDSALGRMQTAAGLWSTGDAGADALVDAAGELVKGGHHGINITILAGVGKQDAEADAPELLEAAMRDVGLEFYPRYSKAGQEVAARVMAARAVTGELTPAAFVSWARMTLDADLELTQGLFRLYAEMEGNPGVEGNPITEGNATARDFDDEILTEARKIAPVVTAGSGTDR